MAFGIVNRRRPALAFVIPGHVAHDRTSAPLHSARERSVSRRCGKALTCGDSLNGDRWGSKDAGAAVRDWMTVAGTCVAGKVQRVHA